MKKRCQNCICWGWPKLDKPQKECPKRRNTTLPHYGGSCTGFIVIKQSSD